jgi:uncharacterized membrane protein YeaQ/YmgE (transglycosylase-associated protein family)
MFLVLAVIVIVLLAVALGVVGTLLSVVWWLIAGLVIGAIARLLVPGEQPIGLFTTSLLGIAGALIGGLVGSEFFGFGQVGQLLLALAASVLLVVALVAPSNRERVGS